MSQPLRVLLIDDDYQDYVITRDLFEDLRFATELEWVSTFDAALEKFSSSNFDIYLIDFRLGQHSGLDVLRALSGAGSRVPAIVLTGTAGQGVDEEVMKAGAVDYLIKGQVTPDALERSLRYARARKEYENKLRLSEDHLRLSLDAAQMAAWDWNTRTNTFTASDRLYEFCGILSDGPPLEPIDFERFIHPDDLLRVKEQLQRAIDSALEFEQEFRIIDAQGNSKWLFNKGRIERDRDGTPISVFGGSTDVTARRQAEEAVRQADRVKDEFLAMLSHELRNPLAAIANAVTLSRLTPSLETMAWSRDLIERQTSHLKRLIDDLLDLSRVNRGKIQLQRELVDIRECIEHAINATEMMFREQQQVLYTHLYPGAMIACVDRTRIEQAMVNLLVNASKYTKKGGSISLSTEIAGDSLTIKVEDSGIGIAPEQLERIFELFSQVDSSLDRAQGGLGIGLTLVRAIAEMHGGNITVSSEGIDKGSTFILSLPLESLPMAETPPLIQDVKKASDRSLTQLVVVDDNKDNADTTAMLLKTLGYAVHTAYEGETALETIRLLMPAAVLLDLGLPGMDGFEIAEELRRDQRFSKLCLIAVSGYGQAEDRQKAEEAGFDHHLVKPVDFDQLAKLLRDETLQNDGLAENTPNVM